ncbi:MAG: hypothetical protein QME55_13975, partial [Brevundimonas sp.]|uniref:hypothetical protein n=1 Tax=Brevundimonas sp. TaxID=1871086 RepID=UPI00260F37B6
MTPWQTGGIAFGMLAYAVAWTWGGRTERLGAVVLLLFCMISTITFRWETGGIYLTAIVEDCLRLLIFGWLSFRVDRWWPLVITAALTLMVLLYAAQLLDPAVTQLAVASANIGLGFIIDLTLLLSVWERWLAGEPAAGPAAWAKAVRRATHGAAV